MDYAGEAVFAKFEAAVEPVTGATHIRWRVSGSAMSLAESATDAVSIG